MDLDTSGGNDDPGPPGSPSAHGLNADGRMPSGKAEKINSQLQFVDFFKPFLFLNKLIVKKLKRHYLQFSCG